MADPVAPPVRRWHLFRRRKNGLGVMTTPVSSHDSQESLEAAKSQVVLKEGEDLVVLEEEP